MFNTKNFQETVNEVLNAQVKAKSKHDEILQKILEKSDKGFHNDFQELLRKNVKHTQHDKVKKELENKVKEEVKDKKGEEPNKAADIKKQVESGADLDKVTKDIEKDDKGESKSSGNELTAREEALKQMYQVALEEYYRLKDDLSKSQIRRNDIALDNRNYLKVLQYENYLRKCDTLFKQSNGSFISAQDPEISKKENKYAYNDSKNEQKIVNQHQQSINEIDELNDEIKRKADQIIDLNEAAQDGFVNNYEARLTMLEHDYVALNAQMRLLRPNLLELYRQEEIKEEQEQATTRVVGTKYERDKNRSSAMNKDVVVLGKKVDGRDDLLDDTAEREKNELQNINIKLANSYIDAAEEALEKDDTVGAIHLINKAKDLVGTRKFDEAKTEKISDFEEDLRENVIGDTQEEDTTKDVEEKEFEDGMFSQLSDEDYEEPSENETPAEPSQVEKELSPLQEECAKAVHTPEEIEKNRIARDEKQKVYKDKSIKEVGKEI